MKAKETATLPIVLLGSALLLLGAAALLYYSTHIEDEEIDFDLWDEDASEYA